MPESYQTIDQFLTLLHDEDLEIRMNAAIALRNFRGEQIIEAGIEMLMQEEDLFVRGEIAETLSIIGDKRILDPFIQALRNDPHWYVRAVAIEVLGHYGDASVEKHLVSALKDQDRSIQGRAADVLDTMTWKPRDASEKAAYFVAKQNWSGVVAAGAEVLASLLDLQYVQNDDVRHKAVECLRQICPTIETIVFGKEEGFFFPRPTTLFDFDASDLTMPLKALKEIHIFSDTYDFRLVERFITYILNVLGETHSKKQIEAHIHGDPEQLHPNLSNNFRNICKHVELHG